MALKPRVLAPFLAIVAVLLCAIHEPLFAQCQQSIITGFPSISTDSVAIEILDNNTDPLGWEYQIGLSGFVPTEQADGGTIEQSFGISGLEPGRTYDVYIRTICSASESSAWNGPFSFNTIILNGNACGLNLAIADNSCSEVNRFPIEVTGFGSNIIGDNVFLSSVDLIISHTFPEDLQISLISPDGKIVDLSSDNGLGAQNYGDPEDLTCINSASFSELACESITNIDPPLIGEFKPEGNLNTFNGSPANGIWEIEICDKSPGDLGILNFIEINLNSITCPVPTELFIAEIHADSVLIEWPAPVNCQAMQINFGPAGFTQGEGSTATVNCLNEAFTITDLTPNMCYDIYLSTVCNGTESPFSCQFSFCTACHNITYLENFDSESVCSPSCLDSCEIMGVWQNLNIDQTDWIVSSGPTPTNFTGPNIDFKGNGNFLYIENQIDSVQMLCQANSEAILESPCIQFFSNQDSCDMSFAYHLFGQNIATLDLMISIDNRITWDTLFSITGEQGDFWQRAEIDLAPYDGRAGYLRFVGLTGTDNFADMAIDDINFYGSIFDPQSSIFYTDADLDGFGDTNSDQFFMCTDTIPLGFAINNLDCDDDNPMIHPDAIEINCNDIDENCNGDFNEMGGVGMIEIIGVNINNELCQGSSDASVSLDIQGGVAPFEYLWSNNTNMSTIQNVSSGFYAVTVEDATGCQTVKDSIWVSISDSLEYEITAIKNVTCLDTDNGSIEILASGGSGAYNYFWSNDNGAPGLAINPGLSEGFYTLTLTDEANCQVVSETFRVFEDEIFTAFVEKKIDLECANEATGVILLNTTGISPIEEILWSDGTLNQNSIQNLEAGVYGVTVSSSDGCTSVVDSIIIQSPEVIDLDLDAIENSLCAGSADGSIDISVEGGTPPYSYIWNNGATSQDLTGVMGNVFYRLTVTDANGCTVQAGDFFVDAPEAITIQENIQDVNCVGSFDGSIEIIPSGGGGNYEYLWNNETYADSNMILNAPPGTYIVTVVDRFGCKSEDNNSFTINLLNTPIEIEQTVIDENLCFSDMTADIAAAVQGTPPFVFNWSNGTLSNSIDGRDTLTNLQNGSYSVTVTDGDGCFGSLNNIIIEGAPLLNFNANVFNISCVNAQDGRIEINALGGTPPYEFSWSNGANTSIIEDLEPGLFSCTISDVNGCQINTQSFIIEDPDQISVQAIIDLTNEDVFDVNLDIDGGIGPYECEWFAEQIINTDECSALIEGIGPVNVQITDFNGCILDTTIIVDLGTNVNEADDQEKTLLINNLGQSSLYLNNLSISNLTVLNYVGQSYPIPLNNFIIDISQLPNGFYLIKYELNSQIKTERFLKL